MVDIQKKYKKNAMQDIKSSKSIRNIPVPSRRNQVSDIQINQKSTKGINTEITSTANRRSISDKEKTDIDTESYVFDYNVDVPNKKNNTKLFLAISFFVIVLFFGIFTYFAKATITIIPKNKIIPTDIIVSANSNMPDGQFGYQVVSVSASTDEEAMAGAIQKVDTKATGTIIVYNTSNTVQNLVAKTRFQTSTGLVYRITKNISVPALKKTSTGQTPGSVIANVEADQSGEIYNIGLSDFSLPGLKGTSKYTQIYARSQTLMKGGFSGEQKMVDSATMATIKSNLEKKLTEKLVNDISSQIPSNFVFYSSAISFSLSETSQSKGSDNDKVKIVLSGNASAVIFDRELLSKTVINSLSSKLVDSPKGEAEIINIDALKFTLKIPENITKGMDSQISFNLAGDTNVVWLYDEDSLKNDVLGVKKGNLMSLLDAKYPTILSAKVKINPFWKQSFPEDLSRINIINGFVVKDN